VEEPDKEHVTEAEKQILRLDILRKKKETDSKVSADKAYFPGKTQAERMTERLKALRDQAEKQPGPGGSRKIEGKYKSVKLTFLQIRALEQLASRDPRLRGSQLVRIALNRLLGIENSAEENELEARIREILKQFDKHS
jgi:hypothetical protein